jgi:hypothetical protein
MLSSVKYCQIAFKLAVPFTLLPMLNQSSYFIFSVLEFVFSHNFTHTFYLYQGRILLLQKFLQYIKYIIVELTPLHHCPLSSPSHSWSSLDRFHLSIYIHVCTVFALYSLTYTLFHLLSTLTGSNPPDKTVPFALFSCMW